MVSRRDYPEEIVEAARSVLLELFRILGEYQNDIVVVGGWVPELLLDQAEQKHIGSIDVDLAIDHRSINEDAYRTILENLVSHGYSRGKQPFIFYRKVVVDNQEIEVQVDFLSGEYGGTGKKHRTQRVQDMQPRKARGVDLAFHMPEIIKIRGVLPNGGEDAAKVQVVSIAIFIVMKAFAMQGRLKEKDAWDIYYCLKNFPGGLDCLIQELRQLTKLSLVQEAIGILAEKFASPSAIGPVQVANFDEMIDPMEREILQRDVYERIHHILVNLGIER